MFASLGAALRGGGLFIFIAICTAAPVNEDARTRGPLSELVAQPTHATLSSTEKALDALIGLRHEFRDRLEQSAGQY